MPDERRFLVGVEEAQPNIMVRTGRGTDESDFSVGELARDGAHGPVIEAVGVEDDRGGIAGEF